MNLLDFFNSIDESRLKEFVVSKQEENLHLDFKTVNRTDLSHGDDKKNFARALSGFANSCGGIIVWGVDARKDNTTEIDCICPIENVLQFVNRLNEFTGIAANPIVDGVEHKPILLNQQNGVAVTYIPESESGPHMAKFGVDQYLKRSGDSFYKMEHFDLEDMFGRRRKPNLELKIKIIGKETLERSFASMLISLQNNGRGTAIAPYLEIDLPQNTSLDPYGYDGNGKNGLEKVVYNRNTIKFKSGYETVVHPGTELLITKIKLLLDGIEDENIISNFIINYGVAAIDSPLVRKASKPPI